MWAVVNGVSPGQRACRMRQLHDARDVGESAHGIRGDGERDNSRAVGELAFQILQVERRVLVDLREPHHQPEVVGELEPRSDVAVVVELCDQDLVAFAQIPRNGAG